MQPRIDNPFRQSARVVGLYVKGQILIAGITTVLYAVGFGLAHLPLWPLVALLNGLCNFIPRFGALLGLAITALAGLLGELDATRWIVVFLTWVIVQAIEGFVLTPRILGDKLGLSPMLVFVALIAGSFLFGPIGLFIAVPALAVLRIFWRYFRERRDSTSAVKLERQVHE